MSWLLDFADHAEDDADSLLDWICTPKHGAAGLVPAPVDQDAHLFSTAPAAGTGMDAVPFAAVEDQEVAGAVLTRQSPWQQQQQGKGSKGFLWPISAQLDSVAAAVDTPDSPSAGVVPDCLLSNDPVNSITGWPWGLQIPGQQNSSNCGPLWSAGAISEAAAAGAESGLWGGLQAAAPVLPHNSSETQFSTPHLITPEASVLLPCSWPAAPGAPGAPMQFRAPGSPPAAVPEAWEPSFGCGQQQQSLFGDLVTNSPQVVPNGPSAPPAATPGFWPGPFASSLPAVHMEPSAMDVCAAGQLAGSCQQMAPGLLWSAQTAPEHSSAGMRALSCAPFAGQHSNAGMGALSCAPFAGQHSTAGMCALSCAPVMGQHSSAGMRALSRAPVPSLGGAGMGAVLVSTPAGPMMMPYGYLQMPASAGPDCALQPWAGARCADMGCFEGLQSSAGLFCQSYRHSGSSSASAGAQGYSTCTSALPRAGSIGSSSGQLAGRSGSARAAEAVLAAAAPPADQAADLGSAQALVRPTLASFASRRSKAAAVADFATGPHGSRPAGQAAAGLTGTLGSSKGSAQIRPPAVRASITKALGPARSSLKSPRPSPIGGPVNPPLLASADADTGNQAQAMSSRNQVLQATVSSLQLFRTQLATKLATLRADLASLADDNHHLQGANMELAAQVQAAMQQAQQQGLTVPPLP